MIGLIIGVFITTLAAIVSSWLGHFIGIPPYVLFWVCGFIVFGISIKKEEYKNHCACPDCNMFTLTAGIIFFMAAILTFIPAVQWVMG